MSDHHYRVERAARRLPRTTRGLVGAAALTFGTVATVVALGMVSLVAVPSLLGPTGGAVGDLVGAVGLALAAGLGAATSGAALWWAVVERPGEVSLLRGGLVGVGVGVLAHPLMWTFALVGLSVLEFASRGLAWFADNDPAAVGSAVALLLLVSVLGLLITGVVTVPAAAVTGVGLAHLRGVAEEVEPEGQRSRHV